MKNIIASSLFTKCTKCGHIAEHLAEVHTTMHFETGNWRDEFNKFVAFIEGKEYSNFNEAYIDYYKKKE